MDYIAVHIKITPFREEWAEIVEAEIADLGFDSFTVEDPFLNAFIPKEQFSEPMLSGFYTADIPLLLEKAASLGLHEVSRRSRDD